MICIHAHMCFGGEVENGLATDLMKLVFEERRLYQSGLCGAGDLLAPEVNGTTFFENAKIVWKESKHQRAGAAYLMGALCHSALENSCSSYAKNFKLPLESAEKYLGGVFQNEKREYRIEATLQNAEIIAPYFQKPPKQILKALRAFQRESKKKLETAQSERGEKVCKIVGLTRSLLNVYWRYLNDEIAWNDFLEVYELTF